MQFEIKINYVDLRVILNNVVLARQQLSIKKLEAEIFLNCTIVDINEKTEIISVVYRNSVLPTMSVFPIQEIELIEFDFFYMYKGFSAKTFILN